MIDLTVAPTATVHLSADTDFLSGVAAAATDHLLIALAAHLRREAYRLADHVLFCDDVEAHLFLARLDDVVADYNLVEAMLAAGGVK